MSMKLEVTMMHKIVALAAWLALFSGSNAFAFDPPPFPRLAASWISNQHYENPAIQRQLARGSIAIVNTWPGWAGGSGMSLEQAIEQIHAINPNTLVFEYIIIDSVSSSSSSPYQPLYQKANQMNWWAYASGTSGTITSVNSGYPDINTTLFTPPDGNGMNWIQWVDQWETNTYSVPTPSLAGLATDNVFVAPIVSADWNRDGQTDSASNSVVQGWYQAGYQSHFQNLNRIMPGKYQIGNIGTWGNPSANLAPYYQGMLNGGVMEGMIGWSWSVETWATWQAMMTWYRKSLAALAAPQLGIFAQVDASSTNYQAVRYGLTSTLMDNGYYQFGTIGAGGGDAPYFDEYDNAGKGTGYLGPATSSPSLTAWQNGVYRRDFQNGIALVNPRGNGPQTVQLETAYQRIAGTQAPSTNNGQVTQTVTLQDRDGIILLRTAPAPAPPTPAPPQNITVH